MSQNGTAAVQAPAATGDQQHNEGDSHHRNVGVTATTDLDGRGEEVEGSQVLGHSNANDRALTNSQSPVGDPTPKPSAGDPSLQSPAVIPPPKPSAGDPSLQSPAVVPPPKPSAGDPSLQSPNHLSSAAFLGALRTAPRGSIVVVVIAVALCAFRVAASMSSVTTPPQKSTQDILPLPKFIPSGCSRTNLSATTMTWREWAAAKGAEATTPTTAVVLEWSSNVGAARMLADTLQLKWGPVTAGSGLHKAAAKGETDLLDKLVQQFATSRTSPMAMAWRCAETGADDGRPEFARCLDRSPGKGVFNVTVKYPGFDTQDAFTTWASFADARRTVSTHVPVYVAWGANDLRMDVIVADMKRRKAPGTETPILIDALGESGAVLARLIQESLRTKTAVDDFVWLCHE